MKKLIAFFLLSLMIFSQNQPAKKDSLQDKSKSVKDKNEALRNEIDSLKKLRDSLEQQLNSELRELYIMKYGREDGAKVSLGQIWTGMTEEMMRDSWGEPDSISINNQNWGKYTQWYYGDIIYFFKDGKLMEWESPPPTE
ncbi:MAG: hypothetical protein U5K00_11600 [Melioribacteraceae bacterium]|nr:hypothetical protein [Melioribacteraceae bacterium]